MGAPLPAPRGEEEDPPPESAGLGAGGLTPFPPQECLSCCRGEASDASQASRLRKSQACDRVLRVCVERVAEPGGCPARATGLVTVAEAACQGYLTAVPQPAPLYLEKILYHLLRNAAGRASGDACWRVADLLRARLLTYRPSQASSKDFSAIAYSSFSVLWRRADALAQPEQPQEEGRAVLLVRLRALRFLLLLEEDGAALPPLQPPFFASQTAQQAAAAAALYEAQQAPSSAFLGRQLGDCLLTALRKEATEPPTLQQSLCFFELTLEQCRHLCKSSQYRKAEEAMKDARGFLGATKSFGDPLSLLEAGIHLNRVLTESAGSAGPPLSQAAAALGAAAEASERFLRVLAESCQFVVYSLGEYAKRSKQQPFSQEDVLGLCAFTEEHCRVLHRLLERVRLGWEWGDHVAWLIKASVSSWRVPNPAPGSKLSVIHQRSVPLRHPSPEQQCPVLPGPHGSRFSPSLPSTGSSRRSQTEDLGEAAALPQPPALCQRGLRCLPVLPGTGGGGSSP